MGLLSTSQQVTGSIAGVDQLQLIVLHHNVTLSFLAALSRLVIGVQKMPSF